VSRRTVRALRWRALGLAAAVVFCNAAGNFLLSWGLRKHAATVSLSQLPWSLMTPAVLAGVSLLILWVLARLALLSWADLSFVLPVTSIGYVLAVVMGRLWLDEPVSLSRWIGAGLIFLGTILAGSTHPRTPEGLRRRRTGKTG